MEKNTEETNTKEIKKDTEEETTKTEMKNVTRESIVKKIFVNLRKIKNISNEISKNSVLKEKMETLKKETTPTKE